MFGENRVQEATPKIAEVAALRPAAALRWHLVGRLQRNKARTVVGWAARVESVDSPRLTDALDAAVLRAASEGAGGADGGGLAATTTTITTATTAATATGPCQRPARPGARLPVLLQLSLDGDPNRGGASPDDLLRLADHVAGCAGLQLHGVMAVAPAAAEPDAAFALLAEHAARLRAQHPEASVISAGMSGDLESAIRHGSTCVRVGTALLDSRPLGSD